MSETLDRCKIIQVHFQSNIMHQKWVLDLKYTWNRNYSTKGFQFANKYHINIPNKRKTTKTTRDNKPAIGLFNAKWTRTSIHIEELILYYNKQPNDEHMLVTVLLNKLSSRLKFFMMSRRRVRWFFLLNFIISIAHQQFNHINNRLWLLWVDLDTGRILTLSIGNRFDTRIESNTRIATNARPLAYAHPSVAIDFTKANTTAFECLQNIHYRNPNTITQLP